MPSMLDSPHPLFAVVGQPNKGKSSIVASLAFDDTVQVSDTPGTTTVNRSFPLVVDGKTLYELYDTPGFQRARGVLEWLQSHDVSASKRPDAIRAFISEHKNNKRYSDEIELLEPIMNGAGIVYVVDGSKPYGEEYEAQMEILRWTGQPSMALINLIGDEDYTDEWRVALGQYFKLIRVYDPMRRDLGQHIALLEAIAQLKEQWTTPVKRSIKILTKHRSQIYHQSSKHIAHLVADSLSYIEELRISSDEATHKEEEKLQDDYKHALRKLEQESQHQIEELWSYKDIQKEQGLLVLDDNDLFSQESASIFGLTKKEIIMTGITGGAAVGAGIDLLFAGHTALLGGAIGAIVGGTSAYLGFDELSETKVLGMKLGRTYIEMGPMKNRNFPYILLGRSLYHLYVISNRSHAHRGSIELDMDESFRDKWLDDTIKKPLEKLHKKFRSAESIDDEDIQTYTSLVEESMDNINKVND